MSVEVGQWWHLTPPCKIWGIDGFALRVDSLEETERRLFARMNTGVSIPIAELEAGGSWFLTTMRDAA
jgi:hypothetical protein